MKLKIGVDNYAGTWWGKNAKVIKVQSSIGDFSIVIHQETQRDFEDNVYIVIKQPGAKIESLEKVAKVRLSKDRDVCFREITYDLDEVDIVADDMKHNVMTNLSRSRG